MKKEIKNSIDLVLKELKNKIEYIENLTKTFLESLEKEIKISELLYKSYQKELKDNNLYSFLNQNLENHINFYIPELKISKIDSLKEKIDKIISYLNQNINGGFQKEEIIEEKKPNNVIDVNYQLKTAFDFEAIGFFDYDKSLFGLCDNNTIKFITKKTFEVKITIKEPIISNIKVCQKNEGNKIFVFTSDTIFFIQIFDKYNEYKIIDSRTFSDYKSLAFNSNLDLIKIFYDSRYGGNYKLEILLYPEYEKKNYLNLLI